MEMCDYGPPRIGHFIGSVPQLVVSGYEHEKVRRLRGRLQWRRLNHGSWLRLR